MSPVVATVLFAVAAYLIGSVSFAVVVSRVMGLADPRTYGSGNPGATNVLRSGNKKAAIFTLLGDAAKGWFAVWLAQRLAPQFGVGDTGIALVTVAVFLGHLYPVFHRFVGGKGVATAAGVLLALERIYINGGRRGFLVSLAPDVLTTVLNAQPVHCANPD